MFNRHPETGVFAHYQEVPKDRQAKVLDPGIYTFQPATQHSPPMFVPSPMPHDEVVHINGGVFGDVVNSLEHFMADSTKTFMHEMGLLWRHGTLLYGAPGTGKSCVSYLICDWLVSRGFVVLKQVHPTLLGQAIELMRELDPDRVVGVILEEFDQFIRDYEEPLLEFLDGPESKDGVFVLATTNRIERIPDRIKARPSRFAEVRQLPGLSASEAEQFIKAKFDQTSKDMSHVNVKRVASLCVGVPTDFVKMAVVRMVIYNEHPVEAFKKVGMVFKMGGSRKGSNNNVVLTEDMFNSLKEAESKSDEFLVQADEKSLESARAASKESEEVVAAY